MGEVIKFISNRAIIIGLLILAQLGIVFALLIRFQEYFVYFYTIYVIVSAIVIIRIINNRSNPAYKIAWLIPIMIIPIFGTVIYLVFGRIRFKKADKIMMSDIKEKEKQINIKTIPTVDIEDGNRDAVIQSNYLSRYGESALFDHTSCEYFALGEEAFSAMLKELEKAEKYIFMEYFIVEEGYLWDALLEVLEKKAKEGLDVRFLYDDVGCLTKLPNNYYRKLEKKGIKACVFNPIIPVLSPIFNNRNHRKITVIDGKVAFTGGINLADEYINKVERFGHWKDNAIMVKGNAAWGFTVLFLSIWQYVYKDKDNLDDFYPSYRENELPQNDGYYQPYVDSPFDNEDVGMTVYLNLINRAKKYVYITTPYLIIDNLLMESLCSAAKGGVDVRIIVPHKPDKWYVHAVTKSNYSQLIEAGVKIYEYTPGFIHSKTFVVDNLYATVGSINLDYRSLFLHLECGLWMYKTSGISEVLKDHLDTQAISQLITLEEANNIRWFTRIGRAILSVFSPLL